MMEAVVALASASGLTAGACTALNVSRASVYRRRARLAGPPVVRHPRPSPRRALAAVERQAVLDVLRTPRFADQAPAEVYASLLDEDVYHCSIRTMYRILAANQEVRERRNQLRHPVYKKPELLAQAPNEVWSWDITKLMGPAKWTYFYLYVIIDIFSRRVVGWCVADRESATLFAALFDDATTKHPAPPGQLTLHADRGGPMRAKATAHLLADLGVTRSHSRPAHLQRQSLLGKPLQDDEVPAAVSTALRQHPGCQGVLPQILRLVQSGAPPCRHRPDDARPGALRSGRCNPRRTPDHPRWRLHQKPGTLRRKGAKTARKADRDMDQSTAENSKHQSLNSTLDCLRIVDTFRVAQKLI
jgi:transposase InsO family protein